MYTFPFHYRGHTNVMLVLQSSSDPLHILPSSSTETNTTPDGLCNFSSTEVEEDVDVVEEIFISVNEEVDIGIKQEEIPGDITFPDIKSEPDEVSYVCICQLLETFYQCPGISVFFLGDVTIFVANWNITTVGNKNVLLVYRWEGLYWMGWSACNCIEMKIYSYIHVGKIPYLQDVSWRLDQFPVIIQ